MGRDLPHTTTTPYIAEVDRLAEACGFPALVVAGEAIGSGADAWRRWVAATDRARLVRALGVLVARAHRPDATA